MPVSSQRRSLRYLVLIIAAVIVAYSVYNESRGQVEVGKMEYKLVCGTLEESFKVIMLETEPQFMVHDSDFTSFFEPNDAEVVSRAEQLKMLQKYDKLEYRVNICLCAKDEQAQYRLSRELFNQIIFETNIKFKTDRKVRDSIITIIEM
jgi:hypothetical protein